MFQGCFHEMFLPFVQIDAVIRKKLVVMHKKENIIKHSIKVRLYRVGAVVNRPIPKRKGAEKL
jgi:hypothetical protein